MTRHKMPLPTAAKAADPYDNVAEDALRRFRAALRFHLSGRMPDGHQVEAWWWEGVTDEERDWVMPVYVAVVPAHDDYEDGVCDLGSATFVEQVRYALHQLTGDARYADQVEGVR